MPELSFAPKSFWDETCANIVRVFKSDWQWILLLSLPLIMARLWFDRHTDLSPLSDNPQSITPDYLLQLDINLLLSGLPIPIILYIYYTRYLPRIAATPLPAPSLGHFFYWLGQLVLMGLVIFGIFALAGVAIGIGAVLLKHSAVATLPFFIGAAAILVYGIHTLFRFSLISPLALLYRKPVLKNGWMLTKGQAWRIFTGAFILAFVIWLIALLPGIGIAIMRQTMGSQDVTYQILHAVFSGVVMNIGILCGTLYRCTAYRILTDEKTGQTSSTSALL